MNRFETLARIGQLPACARVPVVLYSTGMDHVKSNKSMALGAAACISKPDSLAALLAELGRFIGSRFTAV